MRLFFRRAFGPSAAILVAAAFLGTGASFAEDTEPADALSEQRQRDIENVEESDAVGETDSALIAEEEPAALTAAERKGLEEIVVSSRKREEDLQRVPIAVTAVMGSQLEDQHINDTLDIQFKVPNLFFSKTNFTGANLQIRGIGAQVIGATGEAAVGVHVNEVPMTTTRLFEQEFYDIERIEVLRGPQGTLFGRNSTGGSFNVYTRKPTNEFTAGLEYGYGNYDSQKIKGHVNIPIGDRVRTRLAGMFHDRDGYIYNLSTNSDIDDRQLYGVRGSIQVDITDRLVLDGMVSWFKEEDKRSRIGKQLCNKDTSPFPFSIGCTDAPPGFESINSYATLGGIFDTITLPAFGLPALTTPGVDVSGVNPPDLRVQDSRIEPQYLAQELFADLNLDYDLDFGHVSLLVGYQQTLNESVQDYNMGRPISPWNQAVMPVYAGALGLATCSVPDPAGGPPTTGLVIGEFGCNDRSFAQDNSVADSEQITGELRFVSDFEGAFNFTTGAIYSYFVTRTDYEVYFSGAELLARVEQAFIDPTYDVETLRHFNNESKPARTNSFGLFGEGYYEFLETWRVTGGLRYTRDEKDVRSRNYLLDGLGPCNPGTGAGCASTPPPYVKQEAVWNEVTGRVIIDKELNLGFTDASNVYASYSRGYKPGGFNPPAAAAFPGVEDTFDPEFINAVEVGSKNRFLDNQLQANFNGFFYDYSDYQVSKIVNRTSVNENIDAIVWGLEAELAYSPIEGLLLMTNVSYLGSQIKESSSIDTADPTAGDPAWFNVKNLVNGSNEITSNPLDPTNPAFWHPDGGIEKNLNGNELPNTSDVQITIGGSYTFDAMILPGQLTARMSYYWQSEMFARIYNTQRDLVPSWSQADAGLRWNDDGNRYFVEFWIKNFTNNNDITSQYFTDASSGNFTNVFLLDPRTLGFTIGAEF